MYFGKRSWKGYLIDLEQLQEIYCPFVSSVEERGIPQIENSSYSQAVPRTPPTCLSALLIGLGNSAPETRYRPRHLPLCSLRLCLFGPLAFLDPSGLLRAFCASLSPMGLSGPPWASLELLGLSVPLWSFCASLGLLGPKVVSPGMSSELRPTTSKKRGRAHQS